MRRTLFFLLMIAGVPALSQVDLEAEAGRVRAGRADVRIPGDGGTRFSPVDDLDAEDSTYFRLRTGTTFRERHRVFLTWAPLEVEARGTFDQDVRFADTVFPAGSPVNGTYKFDNYRLTYRYLFRERGRFRAEAGATLFVRDARVSLRGDGISDSDDDLGFVPLLSGRVEVDFGRSWMVVADGDALIAPQGRATDVLFALQNEIQEDLRLGLGYRILEGGADQDSVYTFALFHHLALTLHWMF